MVKLAERLMELEGLLVQEVFYLLIVQLVFLSCFSVLVNIPLDPGNYFFAECLTRKTGSLYSNGQKCLGLDFFCGINGVDPSAEEGNCTLMHDGTTVELVYFGPHDFV